MGRLWKAADIVISVPSTDGISEGLLEAMYAGAVPVVSDIPSNRSFLKEGESAYFVSGSNEKELAELLLVLMNDIETIKKKVGDRNREWVRNEASLEGTATEVAQLVEKLAASKKMESNETS